MLEHRSIIEQLQGEQHPYPKPASLPGKQRGEVKEGDRRKEGSGGKKITFV